jgi:hypothetical protein
MGPFHAAHRDHYERTASPEQLTHRQVRLLFPFPHTRNPPAISGYPGIQN